MFNVINCCLALSKPFLRQWSSVERSRKNMIAWLSHCTFPLVLAARITRILSWKFKNFTRRTLCLVGRLACIRPGNLCALSIVGGLWNVACLSASGSHFSRKATASTPSIFLGILTRRGLAWRAVLELVKLV